MSVPETRLAICIYGAMVHVSQFCANYMHSMSPKFTLKVYTSGRVYTVCKNVYSKQSNMSVEKRVWI